MGMSIDIFVFDQEQVEKKLDDRFSQDDVDLIMKAYEEAAIIENGLIIIQSADVWDTRNPKWQMAHLIEAVGDKNEIEIPFDFLDDCRVAWKYKGFDAYDFLIGEEEQELYELMSEKN